MATQIIKSTSNTTYSFTWPSFKSHIVDEVGDLLREEKFVDVTILCDRHAFRAHKVVLSLASPLLFQLLENNPSPEPVISLTDVPWTHLTWILQYVYSGQASVPEEKFEEFLGTAKMLQISSLSNSKDSEPEQIIVQPKRSLPAEDVLPTKKLRLSKRISRRKDQIAPTPSDEIPIIISTQSLESETGESGVLLPEQQIFLKTQPVVPEILKENDFTDPNQEVITIQTSHVDDMQIEEIVEVVTSGGSDNPVMLEPPEDCLSPEVTVSETSEKQLKFLYTPTRSNLKPTHSLAPKKCDVCGKVYSNLSNLRQHINLVHSSHTVVNCPLCGKDFKSELYMRRHLICAHNVTPVKKEPTTKESRRVMNLKACPLNPDGEEELDPEQAKMISEMDTAVENLEHDPLS